MWPPGGAGAGAGGGGRVLEVALGAVDYVMEPGPGPGVPVVRVFGATPGGQRCLVHLHGARPRLYVPLPESLSAEGDAERAYGFMETLRGRLDEALQQQRTAGESGPSLRRRPSVGR